MRAFIFCHPLVNFIYFLCVIGFTCFLMHPVCLVISVFGGFFYASLLLGKRAALRNLAMMLPVLLVAAGINPLFQHGGTTILAYFPNGNPLTLESCLYGLFAAVMLLSVILWFLGFSHTMTSDKLLYLFGKSIPAMSLVFSMTLRFVPRFISQFRQVAQAQKCIGRDISQGPVSRRIKHALSILSTMVTWSLENAVDTADSMKARGYGLPGRTAFSVFRFDKRDAWVLIATCLFSVYVLAGILSGSIHYTFFPVMTPVTLTPYSISLFAAYSLLCALPTILEIREVHAWKSTQSSI